MKPWKLVFIAWVILWLSFLIRGFAKGELKKFRTLAFSSVAEKKAYLLGEELDGFLETCEKRIPLMPRIRLSESLTNTISTGSFITCIRACGRKIRITYWMCISRNQGMYWNASDNRLLPMQFLFNSKNRRSVQQAKPYPYVYKAMTHSNYHVLHGNYKTG